MPRGGKRPGSGRPKGSVNKLKIDAIEKAGDGLSPVDYLLALVRDDNQSITVRTDAAKALLPYTAYRLQAVELNAEVNTTGPVKTLSDEQLIEELTSERDSGRATGEEEGSGEAD